MNVAKKRLVRERGAVARGAARFGCTRVLHIIDKLSNDGSGVHGPARQLIYRLPCYDKQRLQAAVCTLHRDEEAVALLRERDIPTFCIPRAKYDPRVAFDLLRLVSDWQPHVLHLHGYRAWDVGRLVGRWKRIPVVIQEHAVFRKVPLGQQVLDLALRHSHAAALAVSDTVRDFMREKRHVEGEIEVIWNGVPIQQQPRPDAARVLALRAELGVPGDAPLVGLVARLAEGKGHAEFIAAAAQIARARPEVRFLIVGEGPLRGDCEARVKALALADRVIFTGYRRDAPDILAILATSVLASASEGFPGVAIETFAAGTPLVCTDLPAFHGVVAPGREALMVPPGDVTALADAILRILNDPGMAGQMVARALKVASSCEISCIAASYLAVYNRIAPFTEFVSETAGIV